MRRINAPAGKARFGPPAAQRQQAYVTSAFVKEALDKGRELFKWDEKKAPQRQEQGHQGARHRAWRSARSPAARSASTVCSSSSRTAASQFQSGIGNHGTHSVIDVHRVAAEMLGVPWEQCDVVFGNTAKNLPWTSVSAGSQTTHAMTRAAHAAATDAIKKLQEIAAKSRGGNPDSLQGGRRQGDRTAAAA